MKLALHSKSLPFMITALVIILWLPSQAQARPWSERKLDKSILKIDRELTRKRWESVIKQSEKAIPECIARHSEHHKMCIVMLRNINQSYEETRRFNPDHEQIKAAYVLSSEVFGKTHSTTIKARNYYYKYLIFTEDYSAAIPLVIEIIDLEIAGTNDEFRLMQRYNQLYALEGLNENWPAEEAALTKVLQLSEEVLGKDSAEFKAAAEALAHNYCIQTKYHEFFELINQENLQVDCFGKSNS